MVQHQISEEAIRVAVLTLLYISGMAAGPLCPGHFDTQLQKLLAREMLTTEETAKLSSVFQDLQESLQIKWPGSEVIPIGSIVTGLTMKSSDADCIIKVPHYPVYNETANRYLIMQTVPLLRRQPHLYDNVIPNFRTNKIDLLKFRYLPTQKKCDVNFISTHGLEISQMIACYYKFDDRVFQIAAVIKLWNQIHRVNNKNMFSSYTLNLLIIFYLQQINIVPSFLKLRPDCQHPYENRKKFIGVASRSMNMYQVLGGFFKYYSEFNFDEYVVSPLVGRPIHKRLFTDIESLPEELPLFKSYMSLNSKPFALNRRLCVQDVFTPYSNVEENTSPIIVMAFLTHVKFAAEQYKMFPCDHFLKSILSKNKYDLLY